MWVGKDYPQGLSHVRERAKKAFIKNSALTEEDDIMRAVATGRWWVKELIGIVQLRKYRTLRQRYGDAASGIDAAVSRLDAKFKEM